MKRDFFICEHCGNIVEIVKSVGVPIFCCGQKMTVLVPNTQEASTEKHIPLVTAEGNLVKISVGSVEHPMVKEHLIEWISVETNKGIHKVDLITDTRPVVVVALADGEQVTRVLAYCNLHGLWAASL